MTTKIAKNPASTLPAPIKTDVPTAPSKTAETQAPSVTVTTPFTNGKPDKFNFKDAGITEQLNQLHGDAATMERILPKLDEKVVIVGTARSKPIPGANGFEDYAWGEVLGEELRKAELAVGTGAGPGAMEAPLRGHARMDALLDLKAAKQANKNGWEVVEKPDPQRQGAQIILPHEQSSNPFIPEDKQGKFDRFLFRMEFLFRNTRDFVATAGGYGTVAEIFTFMAQKSHGQNNDPIVFGAPDDFFHKFNKAFEPLLNEREKPDLKNIFDDPKKLVASLTKQVRTGETENIPQLIGKMTDQLELGLTRLDGKPPAIAFFGGGGPRSEAMAPVAKEIATAMAQAGNEMRVSGSPHLDKAVLDGARAVNKDAEVQAFAMADAPVQSQAGLEYTKFDDVLTLREIMNTNIKGIVVSPEGAKQLGLLFTAACDIQTGEMPKIPVVVLDPDGKFEDIRTMLKETMLSDKRKYINPEDLDIFTVVSNAKDAIAALNQPQATAPAAH